VAVFASRCALPHVTLSYNEKHEAFAEMLGSPESVISMWGDGFTADALLGRFEHIDRGYARIHAAMKERTLELSRQSNECMLKIFMKHKE
jgi:hypothetical protein